MLALARASIGCLLATGLALTGCKGSRNTSDVNEAQIQESASKQLIDQGGDENIASDRKAAEWAVSRGGKVVLADGTTVEEASEIPSGPIEVVEINVWTKERLPIRWRFGIGGRATSIAESDFARSIDSRRSACLAAEVGFIAGLESTQHRNH